MDTFFAALMFFTRLPWWRLRQVPKEAFEHVVDWWPLMGWLTGGVTAAVCFAASWLGFAPAVAVVLAFGARLLLTGALHEDGLADFCDGFGGGTTRERTLVIMKDSHIGTYGVLGLLFYFGLLWTIAGQGVMNGQTCLLFLFFDVLAKCAASLITGQLPYARTAEGAKNQVVYVGRSLRDGLAHALRCLLALALPVGLLTWNGQVAVLWLLPIPFVVEYLLMRWMRSRLGGYTGDCCGALFLLCELSLYLVWPLL